MPRARVELFFFDKVMGLVTTDQHGQFRFARVPPGDFALRVLGPGFITAGSLPAVHVRDHDVQLRLVANRRVTR